MSGFQEGSEKMHEVSPVAANANGTEAGAAPTQAPEPEPAAAAAAAAAAATGAAPAEGGEKKLSKRSPKAEALA
ncbi:unnamed protein product [Ectocarpus sp. CCAP 1310/34]|nr:unnamed protein product [Ectocarpus sp. CCAP 1310/34]